MKKRLIFALLLPILTTPALAEVVIERSGERIFAERRTPNAAAKQAPSGFFERAGAKGTTPTIWIFPWVIDDSDPFGNSTFFSVRNDNAGGEDADLDIRYYDSSFELLAADFLTLASNQLVPVSVRTVDGLVTIPGIVNRGTVEVETDSDISTDVFEVNFDENFASGDRGFTLDDFCTDWRARFLRFPGTTGGTVLTFLLNGPLGPDDEIDPPTITGEVFTQEGAFVNSFSIWTDDWVLEIQALDLVGDDTEFGTLVMALDTAFSPPGVVLEKHSAFSRFSLGIVSVCDDAGLF